MSTPSDRPDEPGRYGQDPGGEPTRYGGDQSPAPGYGTTPPEGGRGYGDGAGTDPQRYGGEPPASYGDAPAPEPRNGLGVAALVFGIVSVLLACLSIPGLVLGVVAIVLGVAGRRRVSRGEATNKGVATTGLALGVLGVVIGLVFGVIFAVVGTTAVPFINDALQACEGLQGEELQACIDQQAQEAGVEG